MDTWLQLHILNRLNLGNISDKTFGGSSLFPPPHLLQPLSYQSLCPFLGGICYSSMLTVFPQL